MKRLLFVVLLAGCARSVHTRYDPVQRPGFTYQRINDGEVLLAVKRSRYVAQALAELECDKKYICVLETDGTQYRVLQRLK